MPNDSHVSLGDPHLVADLAGRSFGVKRQEHDDPLTFVQAAETGFQSIDIQGGIARRFEKGCHDERLLKAFAASFSSLQIDGHGPAHPENERTDLIEIANRTVPKFFDRDEQHLLDEVARGIFVAKVTESIQPDARCEPAVEFRLGLVGQSGNPRRYRPRELAIG